MLSKAEATAKKIITEAGLDDIRYLRDVDLKVLIQSRGAFYEETAMDGKDGRIVSHGGKSIITLNSSITDPGKKRFTAAHELGHFELHKDLAVGADTQYELCNWYQSGSHEKEANEFASELLMPTILFQGQCRNQKFSPKLLVSLADNFLVSRTAAILKFLKAGNHPVTVVCTQSNKIKWWKMSKSMEDAEHDHIEGWAKYKAKITNNLPPPPDSVAGQVFKKHNKYDTSDRLQEIEKSVWFLTKNEDPRMFEFCHYIPSYDFALSVIWED
ncbi:MAG TPA: ImmA/IrrE family metallo-endopeptidase [Chryseosolibacter sp.]|nr:ImmA/IrrE family metallo-endopeptidase [Chryseosolibacter sp.]